jgi:uncharacterized protein
MRPSQVLAQRRNDILAITAKYRVANVRVFGSVLRGEDKEGSDLDILIDALPEAGLFHLGGLQFELQTSLGIPVDLLTPLDLPERFRNRVVAEARPL